MPSSPSTDKLLQYLLARTSRTFALAIPLLPYPAQREITIAYLLFRIADTIEDAEHFSRQQKLLALDRYVKLIRCCAGPTGSRPSFELHLHGPPCDNEGYLELITNLPIVIESAMSLQANIRERIIDSVERSISGMQRFISCGNEDGAICLTSLSEVRDYCYFVAGVVGELLTEVFLAGATWLEEKRFELETRARWFGEGLQLVNILKDSDDGAREGRQFIPSRVSREQLFGMARDDLTQSKYLGMSPFQCPSLFSILAFLEYEHGVYHPTGGCSAVSEKMADIAREMGVDIRLNEPVERILFSGRRAVGVHTSQDEYGTDALVINADFARAMHRLVPETLRPRWTNKCLGQKKFSCSTFMMYLGVEGRHHTIYIANDYDRNLAEIEQRHVLSEDPSFYVQNACVTDTSLAPSGMSTLYTLVPVTHMHQNVDWSIERDRFRERVMRQLEKVGVRDLEERIRYERIITPADWDEGHQIHLGATFNLAHNLGQMLHRRPHNRFENLKGVYLVGGGTHPGSGLPVIYESARITSKLIQKDLGIASARSRFGLKSNPERPHLVGPNSNGDRNDESLDQSIT